MSSRTNPLYTDANAGSSIEFELPCREFVLDRTLSRFDSVAIEPTRTAEHDDTHEWPSIRVCGTDRTEIGTLLVDDPDIEACTFVLDRGDEGVYRIRWSEQARERINGLCSDEATLQAASASASDGYWTFRVSVPEREALMGLYEQYEEYGFPVAVTRICAQNEIRSS
jgi:hypothetical protein